MRWDWTRMSSSLLRGAREPLRGMKSIGNRVRWGLRRDRPSCWLEGDHLGWERQGLRRGGQPGQGWDWTPSSLPHPRLIPNG